MKQKDMKIGMELISKNGAVARWMYCGLRTVVVRQTGGYVKYMMSCPLLLESSPVEPTKLESVERISYWGMLRRSFLPKERTVMLVDDRRQDKFFLRIGKKKREIPREEALGWINAIKKGSVLCA